MALEAQLSAQLSKFMAVAPAPMRETIGAAKKEHVESFDAASAIQVGAKLPPFKLTNAVGEEVDSSSLLSKSALLITFYRGEWCPFCNIALAGLQQRAAEIKARGVTLVAISPELPNGNLTMQEKHALEFPVLSDVGNAYARQLGIVWKQPDSLRPVFDQLGNDLVSRNGDDSFEVPVPATLLVDMQGVVRNTFVNPDYGKRVEPEEVLRWIDAL